MEGMRLCVVQRSQIDGQNNFPDVVLCLINSYMTAFSRICKVSRVTVGGGIISRLL